MYLPSFSLNDCTTTRLQLASQHGGHDASEQSTLESLMVPQKMFLSSTIGLDPGERFKYHHTRHKRYITFDWCFSAALVGGYPNTMSQVARFVHNNQSQKNISYSHISLMIYLALLDPPNKPSMSRFIFLFFVRYN